MYKNDILVSGNNERSNMMRKTAIFEDVVSIMTQDSATKRILPVRDPTGFRECISDDMRKRLSLSGSDLSS